VADKHVQTRLKRELVIWLVTVGRDGRPHAVPVWFWWDGTSFLIYSVPGQKVRDIEANPNVALHLNSDLVGDEVVRIDGTAKVDPKQAPAYKVPNYVRKYREQIQGLDWTPKVFSEKYHFAIRVRPNRFH
jgi:PPOX class probable F420-dependent enzyme